jgi:hypothetical protein
LVNELDPQVLALLKQFQADTAQHQTSISNHTLTTEEKVAATRQLLNTQAANVAVQHTCWLA